MLGPLALLVLISARGLPFVIAIKVRRPRARGVVRGAGPELLPLTADRWQVCLGVGC
ncbi:hypothetical protein [Nocardia sp. NPDC004750]